MIMLRLHNQMLKQHHHATVIEPWRSRAEAAMALQTTLEELHLYQCDEGIDADSGLRCKQMGRATEPEAESSKDATSDLEAKMVENYWWRYLLRHWWLLPDVDEQN